jgi:AcrR family transcriptional regulator
MPRPSQRPLKRQQLLPEIARTFTELGYRRTTTAELARRCRIRENILYRLWPDKKAMFIAAIDYVYALSTTIWKDLLQSESSRPSAAERLLDYEASHHGEFGFYRIVFAGLSETDDPEIQKALQRMYQRFQRFIRRQIELHRRISGKSRQPSPELAAWAFIGLGTVANLSRELDLLSSEQRLAFIKDVGSLLLDGQGSLES